MPELPEVETTRVGLQPHLVGKTIRSVVLRRPDLRWPIPREISNELPGQKIRAVSRRSKYLLIEVQTGHAIVHLGMSGVLRVTDAQSTVQKHDHFDFVLSSNRVLRFTDPRRFGCLLWQPAGQNHTLLAGLGPEPLSPEFTAEHLFRASRNRSGPIKNFIMDGHIVVGVGNIYAAESLFQAGIAPTRAAGSISLKRYERLVSAIRDILTAAINRGGTTLRDFLNADGLPGYFEQELNVYGRVGERCVSCNAALKSQMIGQRASVWCPRCQR